MDSETVDDLMLTARGKAGRLPGRFFHAENLYALEVERFFRRQWLCIGLSADASRPGDWCPAVALDQSLVMVRDSAGKLNVFYNVCSHRGAQLLAEPYRGPTVICPYHCWAYNTNGELICTPHVAGAAVHDDPAIDRSKHGLRAINSVEYAGLVYACLDEPMETFTERVDPLRQRWSRYDFTQLECVPGLGQQPIIQANWKIVVENFVESYHLGRDKGSLNAPMCELWVCLSDARVIAGVCALISRRS